MVYRPLNFIGTVLTIWCVVDANDTPAAVSKAIENHAGITQRESFA